MKTVNAMLLSAALLLPVLGVAQDQKSTPAQPAEKDTPAAAPKKNLAEREAKHEAMKAERKAKHEAMKAERKESHSENHAKH